MRNLEVMQETAYLSEAWGAAEKSERYDWSKDFGEPGRFEMLDKNVLKVDLDYQRPARSRARVLSIARDFRWTLFGIITVVQNKGDYFVVDGGHRVRSTLLREEIKLVPCMVYSAKSIQDEADMFVRINTTPIGVGAYQRHKAGLCANYAIAMRAEEIVQKNKYSIVPTGPIDWQIECIGAIYAMISRSDEMAEKTFRILTKVAMGQTFTSKPLKGLFYLMAQNQLIDFEKFPLDNMQCAGIQLIESEIRRMVAFKGKGGEKIYAEGMLEIINKGQTKNRVMIPF